MDFDVIQDSYSGEEIQDVAGYGQETQEEIDEHDSKVSSIARSHIQVHPASGHLAPPQVILCADKKGSSKEGKWNGTWSTQTTWEHKEGDNPRNDRLNSRVGIGTQFKDGEGKTKIKGEVTGEMDNKGNKSACISCGGEW